jgi:hypothetical protein
MINFIDDNVFIVLYVSYAILLFKNILGTYIVMSSIFFKTGQKVKLPMVVDFIYWASFGLISFISCFK